MIVQRYQALGYKVERGLIMASFGCNFEGDIPVARIVDLAGQILALAERYGIELDYLSLADTMAWATPEAIRRVVGAVRERFPEVELALHLHDTRGMGIANAYAGIEMGIAHFDAAVAGLGGCPFAGHAAAAGNVCTEDLCSCATRWASRPASTWRRWSSARGSPRTSSATRCRARS